MQAQITRQSIDGEAPLNALDLYKQRAIAGLRRQQHLIEEIQDAGASWSTLMARLLEQLPEHLDGRSNIACHLVRDALNKIFGP